MQAAEILQLAVFDYLGLFIQQYGGMGADWPLPHRTLTDAVADLFTSVII
jgi:hypothetical protein